MLAQLTTGNLNPACLPHCSGGEEHFPYGFGTKEMYEAVLILASHLFAVVKEAFLKL